MFKATRYLISKFYDKEGEAKCGTPIPDSHFREAHKELQNVENRIRFLEITCAVLISILTTLIVVYVW